MPADSLTRQTAYHHLFCSLSREDRIPAAWRGGLAAGRFLLLSPSEKRPRRPDTKSAQRRNEIVAALADEVLIIHAEPGGSIERISELIVRWSLPRRKWETHQKKAR